LICFASDGNEVRARVDESEWYYGEALALGTPFFLLRASFGGTSQNG